MRLDDLLKGVEYKEIIQRGGSESSLNYEVSNLTYDSREVRGGSCFFAIVGEVSDGHNYIAQAVERGAGVVVCEQSDKIAESDAIYIVVEKSESAMAQIAKNMFGDPSRELKLVGVTGTNGKTTTATLLADLFEELGFATGLISTVTYRIAGRHIPSTHTTPDTIRLNSMLREMVDAGCEYCFMEVSSHSVVQQRIAELSYAGALFTNLTHDHLDYHNTFANYIRAKQGLFDGLSKSAFALTNIDDRNGEVMVQNSRARRVSYSLRSMADLRAKVIEMHLDGMLLSIDGAEVWVRILGRFNAYNILAVYGVAREFGVSREDILIAMSRLGAANGRFEHFAAPGGRTIIIDYAHTPDAISSVLSTINEIQSSSPSSGVVVVCGCGGDRDKSKRGEMARIAYEGSSVAIFTSDNPRTEDPEQILAEMIDGVKELPRVEGRRWIKVSDRAEAIRMGVMLSGEGDVILIAGKGHEKYQIVGQERRHFDDREQAQLAVKQYLGEA